MNLKFVGATGP